MYVLTEDVDLNSPIKALDPKWRPLQACELCIAYQLLMACKAICVETWLFFGGLIQFDCVVLY